MVWCSVLLSAVAQLLLKKGLTDIQAKGRLGIVAVALQPKIWLWALSFVAAMGLWLVALQKVDLSYAYPLVSVGYIVVSVLSATLFHEKVDGQRWLGVAVISAGVVLIAST